MFQGTKTVAPGDLSKIVAAQGGTIHAENRIGPDGQVAGARFTVVLPEARR